MARRPPAAAPYCCYPARANAATDEIAVLLARDPAARTSLDNPDAVAGLLNALRAAWLPFQLRS
jgi:hypothetical protein